MLCVVFLFLRDNSFEWPRNKRNRVGTGSTSQAVKFPWGQTQLDSVLYHYVNYSSFAWFIVKYVNILKKTLCGMI